RARAAREKDRRSLPCKTTRTGTRGGGRTAPAAHPPAAERCRRMHPGRFAGVRYRSGWSCSFAPLEALAAADQAALSRRDPPPTNRAAFRLSFLALVKT